MIKKYKNIFIVVFVAALTRLIAINQSLWLDEGTTWRVVHGYSYPHILTEFLPFDFHPPLYYFLIKAWTSIFGYSELSLRMPSVIFSLLTGFIVYITAKKLIKPPAESRLRRFHCGRLYFFYLIR